MSKSSTLLFQWLAAEARSGTIVKVLPFIEYHPEQFPGAIFRSEKPRTVTLLFSTVKMVCVGAKSVRQARSAVKKVIEDLKKTSDNYHW